MSTSAGRASSSRRDPSSGARRGWVAAAVAVLIVVAIFVVPMALRYIKAPPISEGFGLEDAVVALRIEARDTSYLVLVNEEGDTRSAQLDERGFEQSGIAWSEAGLSTGGPADEYLLREDGLVRMPLPGTNESSSERARIATDEGFTVFTGSAQGDQLAFVDAGSDELTAVDVGHASVELADCDGEAVTITEDGVQGVTPESSELAGLGMFDDVVTLACDDERLYGLGEISDSDPALQKLRVWDRATGEMTEHAVRYPDALTSWRGETAFVRDGRLFWAADWRLWSAPLAGRGPGDAPPSLIEAEEAADLGTGTDGLDLVVGTSEGVLAPASERAFAVSADEEFINPSKGPSYDKLLDLSIVSVDVATGERRVEIDVDGIDFPRRDLHVHAIAVNPAWAAGG